MLNLVVVLVCVCNAFAQSNSYGSQSYAPPPPVTNYANNGYGNDYALLGDIRALAKNASVVKSKDNALDEIILALIAANDENTFFNNQVKVNILPSIFSDLARQNREIADLESQATQLVFLADDIAVLQKAVSLLKARIPVIVAREDEFARVLKDFEAVDLVQDATLAQAKKDLDAQTSKLAELEALVVVIQGQIANFRRTLEDIFGNINAESAQTFTFELSAQNNRVTRRLSEDFSGRKPAYQWGVISLHISDNTRSYVYNYGQNGPTSGYAASNPYTGYGSNGNGYSAPPLNPSISYDVDVEYDDITRDVTVTLEDFSTGGFRVEKVTVQVVFYRLEHDTLVNYGAYSSKY
ncbi:unnamed protein product [Lymnaea stagnalis]|uniref:Uncharacterized protein n=1 Tax=Lymnaea stagnalis TaxID=6523 RepID=A0AAV2IAC7_LYMST